VQSAILARFNVVNEGAASSYGHDEVSARARARLCATFGASHAQFAATGTGANVLALGLLGAAGSVVVSSQHAHLRNDEAGALERALACQVLGLESDDGRIDITQIGALRALVLDTNTPGLGAVSLTQATERGICYSLDEIRAIVIAAHDLGAKVHVDGARLANALVSPASGLDGDPRRLFELGVDAISFSLTKNGAMNAEVVLLRDPPSDALQPDRLARSLGQTLSKSRYVAVQFETLLEDGLWLELAASANERARELASGLAARGLRPEHDVQANEVFVRIPDDVRRELLATQQTSLWDASDLCRFVTSWATSAREVANLLDKFPVSPE
jgi:threonine aldolase